MTRIRPNDLDRATADRILTASVSPDDAPPGCGKVATLLRAARPEPVTEGLAREAATVAAMRAAMLGHPVPLNPSGRKHMVRKTLVAKAAVVAAVAVLGATGAAATTGGLPGAAQSTARDMLATLGITVPGPNSHSAGHPDSRGNSATGPSTNATFGLCTAKAASAGHPSAKATVFPSSSACSTVSHPGLGTQGNANQPASVPNGPPTSTPGSSHAPVSTPNLGSAATSNPGSGAAGFGTGTGSSSSGGANATGGTAAANGSGNSANRGRP